jgi:hypothetical protein
MVFLPPSIASLRRVLHPIALASCARFGLQTRKRRGQAEASSSDNSSGILAPLVFQRQEYPLRPRKSGLSRERDTLMIDLCYWTNPNGHKVTIGHDIPDRSQGLS